MSGERCRTWVARFPGGFPDLPSRHAGVALLLPATEDSSYLVYNHTEPETWLICKDSGPSRILARPRLRPTRRDYRYPPIESGTVVVVVVIGDVRQSGHEKPDVSGFDPAPGRDR